MPRLFAERFLVEGAISYPMAGELDAMILSQLMGIGILCEQLKGLEAKPHTPHSPRRTSRGTKIERFRVIVLSDLSRSLATKIR